MSDDPRQNLSAYLDGELVDAEADAVRQALEADPEMAAEADALRALKATLASMGAPRDAQPHRTNAAAPVPAARVEPPAALRARVERLRHTSTGPSHGASPGTPAAPRRRWPWVLAAAAAAVLMVTALWMLPQPEGPEILVAHHVKRTAGTPELEVASADPATVAAHFRDKVPFEPQVPTIEGASLLGGRLCSIDDERVQLLFYARGDAVTSVFVSGQKRWDAGCEDVDGHRVCYAPGASTTAIGIGPDAERLGNTHR